ncbi:hypothetical protein EDD18DRAFT_406259 [Armillaria luteobubalina]|uniref:Uncharacterized protein n=1 Tax=Armillaria luteobubalina TaxID=153913 RepID=A0AA39Q1E4_9AGAR|nr:hypothetical protein EDD18DRAFT_406259 [Armillaria luteobubalina]
MSFRFIMIFVCIIGTQLLLIKDAQQRSLPSESTHLFRPTLRPPLCWVDIDQYTVTCRELTRQFSYIAALIFGQDNTGSNDPEACSSVGDPTCPVKVPLFVLSYYHYGIHTEFHLQVILARRQSRVLYYACPFSLRHIGPKYPRSTDLQPQEYLYAAIPSLYPWFAVMNPTLNSIDSFCLVSGEG